MSLIRPVLSFYDTLERCWEGPSGHRLAGSLLVGTFLVCLMSVELGRVVTLPGALAHLVPKNHLASIGIALTLLLVIEVMGLVFSMVHSVSTSVGRQLEILSLILLRNVFKEISHHNPLSWETLGPGIPGIVAAVSGALIVFGILSLYYRVKKHATLGDHEEDRQSFIAAKKCIALALLTAFHLIAFRSLFGYATGTPAPPAFETVYTLLVLSNIFIVLLSLRHGHNYRVAFRNSGFAVVTVLILIALVAPPLWSAGIGTFAALFALATFWVFGRFEEDTRQALGTPASQQGEEPVLKAMPQARG
ncbi:hypothetical protein [Desulfoluna spongiiphila]|uniref:Uncharacterized protein n=1 Tax=Desulfoluna spongiiphila TaxID=419481 RepID=A0A1G5BIQ6_9BACT|nr:hypothetical protein [Desulfoluna spongiiphila]SCX90082.1 hypothetical protein SAMN05216233_10246 [Desulfoluna spongiiphila]